MGLANSTIIRDYYCAECFSHLRVVRVGGRNVVQCSEDASHSGIIKRLLVERELFQMHKEELWERLADCSTKDASAALEELCG